MMFKTKVILFFTIIFLAFYTTGCGGSNYNLTFKEFLTESNDIKREDLDKYQVEGLSEEEKIYWYNYIKKQKFTYKWTD